MNGIHGLSHHPDLNRPNHPVPCSHGASKGNGTCSAPVNIAPYPLAIQSRITPIMDPGNGVFSYRHGMSVGQIFVSSFFLYIAGLFKRSNRSGWSTKSTFSLFRIVGGSCLLALINDRSDVLWVVAFVCEWKGVLLVLFLLVEVLQDM